MFKLSEVIQSPPLSQSVPNSNVEMEHFAFPKGKKIPIILYFPLIIF